MGLTTSPRDYDKLLERISGTYIQGRMGAMQAVNAQLIETYWQVGQHIVEFEQGGKIRAGYGKKLINRLARDLSLRHGRGFSRSNLVYMRLFYQRYPISQKPSHQLKSSQYIELMGCLWIFLKSATLVAVFPYARSGFCAIRRCTNSIGGVQWSFPVVNSIEFDGRKQSGSTS